jgi:hypothetical protein
MQSFTLVDSGSNGVTRKGKSPVCEAPQHAAVAGEEERTINPNADPNCAPLGLRRHEEGRQVLERALVEFVGRYALPAGSLERLSDEIYRLWRDHEWQKRLAVRERRFNEDFRHSARAYARRKLQDKDEDTLIHAARMVRYGTLRKRKLSHEDAVRGALMITYQDLSSAEMRAARKQILVTTITGRKDRQASATVRFLKDVAAVLARETGHPIRFSSYTCPPEGAPGRHYGPEFDVVQAAAEMAGKVLSNEALAAIVRRIRRDTLQSAGVKK